MPEDVDDSDEFVRLLYVGMLGREPDETGFRHNVVRFQEARNAGRLTAFVKSFVDSPEARRNRAFGRLPNILEPRPTLGTPAFRHALSIGWNCYPSWLLKTLDLKTFSGPFDWVFSSLPMVIHCIEDDFNEFLNETHFRPVKLDNPKLDACVHEYYRERFQIHRVFNHHDPSKRDVLEYYRRCVDRFRRVLKSTEPTLLLFIADTDRVSERDLARLSDIIGDCGGNVWLLAILLSGRLATPIPRFSFQQRPSVGRTILIDYQPVSVLHGLNFTSSFDDLVIKRFIKSLQFSIAPPPRA